MRRSIPELPLDSGGSSGGPVGDWNDKLPSFAGVHPGRKACEGLGEDDARIAVHNLYKHLEKDIPKKHSRLAGKLGGSLLVMCIHCSNDALKEKG